MLGGKALARGSCRAPAAARLAARPRVALPPARAAEVKTAEAPASAAAAGAAAAEGEAFVEIDLPKPLGLKFARGNDGGAYVIKNDPALGNTDPRVQRPLPQRRRRAAAPALASSSGGTSGSGSGSGSGGGSAAAAPADSSAYTCRRCRQEFSGGSNGPSACRFHPCIYTGGEVAKAVGFVRQSAAPEHQLQAVMGRRGLMRFWDCCGDEDEGAPGCCGGFHLTYDSELNVAMGWRE
ncbi:hypothetical protein Rsub_01088 [Raphidocelis subcapitata]|uniref:Uncharacterized protein n=1 Tax=Raphidocelis subcapitata TaxID=307507 RepID=A0A2V0NLR1_9CHLO|nr:hypothetical protein Rsub_01088 [Raphidocelis subcapitata]|eukprot:GBF88376.1 hypothetical protein Rsub_01088 [Raphidocelis subcapitata]